MSSASSEDWILLGSIEELRGQALARGGVQEITVRDRTLALIYSEGEFRVIHNKCNHMGGPLGRGKLKKGCVECPWHYWQFDSKTGVALSSSTEPLSSHGGSVPCYAVKAEGSSLFLDWNSESPRERAQYNKGSGLGREVARSPGRVRVLGISTTGMDPQHPRESTSELLLENSLHRAQADLGVDIQLIKLSELKFRNCEGFYSKSERACTWPCSITKMDPEDEMARIYEALVHWSDVVVVATPIRWGRASSLYYKMAERLNSVQNQITVNQKVLITNKVAGFLITGGQDNIQSVAGDLLNFFGELGFVAPAFPYVGHSLGWSSENMEKNVEYVRHNDRLAEESFLLIQRSVDLAKKLLL